MKLSIPKDFTPDVDSIKAKLAESQHYVDTMRQHGFENADINIVIENTSVSDIESAIACISIVEGITIQEAIVKHVSSAGVITKTKDRETRKRNAYQTTGLTKSARRKIARKAAKTKLANPSIGVKAQRKTKKALKKRKALGLS